MAGYVGVDPVVTNITSYLGAFRNVIINGAMNLDQRGEGALYSNLGAGQYILDRWFGTRTSATAGAQAQRIAGVVNGNFQNVLKLSRLAGNAGTDAINLWYSAETSDSIPLVGAPATLSFWAKAGANLSSPFTYSVITGTGTDQRLSSGYTGSSTLITGTAALSATLSQFIVPVPTVTGSEIGLKFSMTVPSGVAGADDSVSITGVQLEPGAFTSPVFERRGSVEELMAQRYYSKTFSKGFAPGNNVSFLGALATIGLVGTMVPYVRWQFPTRMRIIPTMLLFNPGTGAVGQWNDQAGHVLANAQTTNNGDLSANVLDGGGGGAIPASNSYFIQATADSEV